jgi:RsiW-degrading membrane proteinase PrsW (M82 family)
MRWRPFAFTVLVMLTIGMAGLFVAFCLRLVHEGDTTPLVIGAAMAGVLTLFGVWASEQSYRNL